jgi:hypothetical protein
MKKEKNKYTTIQVNSDINEHIREFCNRYGVKASAMTEKYWVSLISASMSGSIVL